MQDTAAMKVEVLLIDAWDGSEQLLAVPDSCSDTTKANTRKISAPVRKGGYTATWVLQVEVGLGMDSAGTHRRTLADCTGVIKLWAQTISFPLTSQRMRKAFKRATHSCIFG
jgi:hypothetical protein